MSSQPTIRAAGCLLWRRTEAGTVEVALVHRLRYDDWTLPKGKLEEGEAWPTAAVREVAEETGFDVVLGPPLPTQAYEVDGMPKEVHYWSAEVTTGGFVPNLEVDAVRWLTPGEARATLSYAHDAEVLAAFEDLTAALDGSPPDTLVVLRHARATKRAAWDGHDRDRPLDDRGAEDATRADTRAGRIRSHRGALVRHDALPGHGGALRDRHESRHRRRASGVRARASHQAHGGRPSDPQAPPAGEPGASCCAPTGRCSLLCSRPRSGPVRPSR